MRAVLLALLCALPSVEGAAQPREQGHARTDDDVRIAYELHGRGDTILVVHGGPGLGFRYLVAGLAPLARAHTLLFYDQRGTGSSDVPDSTRYSIDHYLADLESVRRHTGAQRVTLLGHSWGAALAALYAARFPSRVRAIVLLAPMPARARPWADSIAAAQAQRDPELAAELGRLAQQMLRGTDPERACHAHMRALLRIMSVSGGDDAMAACDAPAATVRARDHVVRWTTGPLGAWDWRGEIAWVDTPALVLHGELDALPAGAAAEWAGTLGNARQITLPGAGHMPQLDAPAQFLHEVERFLTRPQRRH